MKPWIAPAVGLALVASTAFASLLKVRTLGKASQQIVMCPECNEKVTCAKAGDYLVGLDVNLDSPKTGASTVAVHVMDKDKKPIRDAKVKVALTMPGHGHKREPLMLRNTGHGRYEAATMIVMPGAYQADADVTTAGGDTVKQSFSFSK